MPLDESLHVYESLFVLGQFQGRLERSEAINNLSSAGLD